MVTSSNKHENFMLYIFMFPTLNCPYIIIIITENQINNFMMRDISDQISNKCMICPLVCMCRLKQLY